MEEQMRQAVEDLICSDIPPAECLLKLATILFDHQTDFKNGNISLALLEGMMELTLLRLEQIIFAAQIQQDDSAGKQEHQPLHLQAWQCGMQAYDILREGWLFWSDGTSAGTMQDMCYGFWETIAALLLQPDLSSGSLSYQDQAVHLHQAGILQPVLKGLYSAGKALGLPFLAHADVQPAACLLILLQACPVQEQYEGGGAAHEVEAVLHGRLIALSSSFQDRAAVLTPTFQAALALAQASSWRNLYKGNPGHAIGKWLQKLRSNQPEDPAFDACMAATSFSIAGAMASHGLCVLQTDNMAAAIACIAHRANADLLMRSLLASEHCKGPAGRAMALAILTACYEEDADALLLGCTAALKPENNCSLDMRIQCLKTMESVSLWHHNSEDRTSGSSDADESGDDMAADVIPLTWPPQAADLLLYTLTNDPSIRARRAAMKTLEAAQGQLGCKGRIVHTLLLKCRDRDKRVQLSAYEQLASIDSQVLHENMRPLHWRVVLDAGLGVGDGAQLTCDGKGEHERLEELRKPVLALLKAYLTGCGQAFDLEGAMEGLKSLGIFRASNVAQSYCEAIQELAEQTPEMATML